MKRIAFLASAAAALIILTAAGSTALAQEAPAEKASKKGGEGEQGGMELWKWANFLVLAGGLGYLTAKNAGPFFAARSRQIRKDMIEAGEVRKQAEAHAAEVDLRLARLEMEIAALRTDSERETQSEAERLSQYAIAEIAKVHIHAQREIVAAGRAARLELKVHSGKLAIALAEQKIRGRMGTTTQDLLVQNFVRKLEPPAART